MGVCVSCKGVTPELGLFRLSVSGSVRLKDFRYLDFRKGMNCVDCFMSATCENSILV